MFISNVGDHCGINYLFKSLCLKVIAIILIFCQVFSQSAMVYASQTGNYNSSSIHNQVNHDGLLPGLAHENGQVIMGFNSPLINSTSEISSILHSIVNSSLDLNSLVKSQDFVNLPHEISLSIGLHSLTVKDDQFLTPAEAVTVNQLLTTGQQSLVLNSLGQAVGGSLNVSILGNNINNLELPRGVTLIDTGSNFLVNGNLVNYGDIEFTMGGSLQANAIVNEGGSLISSSNSLVISSNYLLNEGGLYGANGVSLVSPFIYNSGTIEAGLGNINISGVNTLDVTGTQDSIFQAGSGDINLEVGKSLLSNSNLPYGMNLIYGNYLSHELNLNANSGYVQGFTGNVTGQINTLADSVHLATQSGDMVIGNTIVNGDPTYVNTNGNITLNGSITTDGAPLSIIASGNINIASGSATSINTQANNLSGGNVVMIAGVGSNISYSGANNTTGIPLPGIAIGNTETVSVQLGASSGNTGGNIDLVTNNNLANGSTIINTAGSVSGASTVGGNVVLVAIANGSVGGEVLTGNGTTNYAIEIGMPGTSIVNGQLTVISSANSGTGINLGSVISTNGTFASSAVELYTANPLVANIVFDSSGNYTGSISANVNSLSGSDIVINSSLNLGGVQLAIISGGSISIASGASLNTLESLNLQAATGGIGSALNPVLTEANSLTLLAPGGSAYINDSSKSLTLNNLTVSSSGVLDLSMTNTAFGMLTINGLLSAGNDSGTGEVIINIDSAISNFVTSNSALIQSGSVNLVTGGGSIGKSGNVNIDTSQISVKIANNLTSPIVNLTDSYSGLVNLSNSNINIGNNGTFSFEMTNSTLGSIFLNGSMTINNGIVNIVASGSGSISQSNSNDILTANSITLSTSGNNIGTANLPINTAASTLSLSTLNNSSSSGSIFINSQLSLNSFSALAGNQVNLQSFWDLYLYNVTGDNINISAGSSDIYILGNIGNPIIPGSIPTSTVTLSAKDIYSYYVSPLGYSLVGGGMIYADNLSLTGINNIGQPNLPVNISAINLNLYASGNVVVNNQNVVETPATGTTSAQYYPLEIQYNPFVHFDYLSLTSSNSIVTNSPLTASSSSGSSEIDLTVLNNGTIIQNGSSNTFTANTIKITADTGVIGSASMPLYIDSNNIFINSYASVFLNDVSAVNINSSFIGGTFSLVDTVGVSMTSNQTLTAIQDISINSSSSLNVSNVYSLYGGINLTNTSNELSVNSGSVLDAGNGVLILNSLSTTNGLINIGSNSVLVATNASNPANNNEIILAIGSIPSSPTNTNIPNNATVKTSNGGNVYFGVNSITANSPVNNISADTYNVVFSGSSGSNAIVLSGGDTIIAQQGIIIPSLDLTQSSVTSALINMQSAGIIGGSLIVNSSGVATGGNVIFNPQDILTNLSALNIPYNVSVQVTSLSNSVPLNEFVNITANSSTSQVTIDGTEQFTTTGGGSLVNIYTNGSVLIFGGNLSSDGNLNVVSYGNFTTQGSNSVISAVNRINISTSPDSATSSINLYGELMASSAISVITLASSAILGTSIIDAISAGSINLTSYNGEIGMTTYALDGSVMIAPIYINSTNLYINMTGLPGSANAAYISDAASSLLVGNGEITATNGPSLYYTMTNSTSGSITVDVGGLGAIPNTYGSTLPVNYFETINLTASGSGTITSNSKGAVIAQNLNLTSDTGNIGTSQSSPLYVISGNLTVSSSQGNVYLNSNAISYTQNLDLPVILNSSGTFYITGNSSLNVTYPISVGSANGSGQIIITVGNVSSGFVQNFTAGTVNIGANEGSIGSSSSVINIDSANISLNALNGYYNTSSVYADDTYTGTINLSASSAGVDGVFDLQASGNLNITGNVSAGTTFDSGIIGINLLSNSSITNTSNSTITAGTINITSNSGNIGVSDISPLYINTAQLTLNTNDASAYIDNSCTNILNLVNSTIGGGLYLTDSGAVSIRVMNAFNNVNVLASSDLSVYSNLLVTNGGISLVSSGNSIFIGNSINIDALNGSVIINDTNTVTGSITIGSNVNITGYQVNQPSNNNEVIMAIGNIPTSFNNSQIPANVVVNNINGANVYFGTNSITASAPVNTINANTYNVVFSGSSSSTPITLSGGVIINAQPGLYIPSLDLTQSFVATSLVNLQSSGLIGGALTLNNSGVAIGGNVILTPQDYISNLSAMNIPAGVTLTLNGFTNSTPVNVNLSNASTTQQVIINGIEQFITSGGGSSGQLNISSSLSSPNQPLLLINGSLTSDGSLNVDVMGNINVTNNAIVSAVNSINLLTLPGSNGSITNDGSITATSTSSIVTLNANGTGSISSGSSSAVITANTVSLTSLMQSIGLSAINPIYIDASNLIINTQYSAYLNDSATSLLLTASSVNVGNSAVFSLLMSNNTNGNIVIGNGGLNIGNGTLDLSSTNISQSSSSDVLTANTMNFSVGGLLGTSSSNPMVIDSGNLNVNANGASVYLSDLYTNNVVLNTINQTYGGPFYLTSASGIIINGVLNGNQTYLTASGNGTITSANPNDIIYGEVILASSNGNIGVSQADPLYINSIYISVNNNASAFISNAFSGGNQISNSNVSINSAGTFYLSTPDAISDSGIYIVGSLTVGTDTGSGQIILSVGSQGEISQANSSDIITAGSINLTSDNSGIGISNSNKLVVDTANLTANSAYSNVFISNNYTGNLNLNQSGSNDNFVLTDSGSITMAAASVLNANLSVSLTSETGLYVNSIAVASGTMSLITAAGILDVTNGSTLYAGNGALILNNTNSTGGSITIGSNVSIDGYSGSAPSNNNEIILAIGSIPTSPQNTTQPANVTVNTSNGANVYFGINNIIANTPNNAINANTWSVVFNGSSSTTPITLDGGVTINSNPGFYINSLDLTNSTVTANLLALQSNGSIGGNLVVNSSGVATGGNVIFYASKDNLSQLAATDIPANVTVEFNGYTSSNPVQTNLTNLSTSQQVLINGSEEFITTGSASGAIVNVSDSLTTVTQPLMLVGGSLTSDGSLSVNVSGSLSIAANAIISSQGNLSLEASGNVSIANAASVTSQGDLSIQNATGSSGSITIDGDISANATSGVITLASDGSGNITNAGINNAIIANTLNLITTGGNIGNSQSIPLYTNALNINFTTQNIGNIYVYNLSSNLLNIGSLNSQNISIVNNSAIDIAGNLTASGDIFISAGSSLTIGANITANNSVNLNASQNGSILANSPSDVITGGSVFLATVGENIGSSNQYIYVNTENLNIYALGGIPTASAYVNDINSTLLNLNSAQIASLGSLNLSVDSSCNILGPLVSGSNFNLSAAGDIIVGDTVTGSVNSIIDLIANGSISTSANSDVLSAFNVELNTDGQNIGSNTQSVMLNAASFSVNTLNSVNLTGSAYINDAANSVILNTSSLGTANSLNLVSLGSVLVSGSVTAGSDSSTSVIDINANGSINTVSGSTTDSLVAGNVNLNTSNAGSDIGSLTQGVLVDANNVSVTTGKTSGSAYVYDLSPNNITITSVSVGTASNDTFGFSGFNSATTSITLATGLIISAPNIIVASINGSIGDGTGASQVFNINSNNVTFNAMSNSVYVNDIVSGPVNFVNITSGSNVVSNAADLNGGGTYYFSDNNSNSQSNFLTINGASISGNFVQLSSKYWFIGASNNFLNLDANNLSINTTIGAYLNDTANNVTLNNFVLGQDVGLTVVSTGGIVVDGSINAGINGGVILLTASGTGNITSVNSTDVVTANRLFLTSASGSIGTASNNLFINTDSFIINTAANSYLNDSANTAFVSNANITVGSAETFSLIMNNATSGSITIASGGLSIANGTITLQASGSGNITEVNLASILTATSINLASDSSDLGSSSSVNSFIVNSPNLSLNTAASAYINDLASSVNLDTSSVGAANILNLTTQNIIINGQITAGTDNGSGAIFLNANGTINTVAGSVTDILTAGYVNLNTSASGGNIGSLTNGVLVDSDNVSIATGNLTGSAFVNDVSVNNITIDSANIGDSSSDTFGFSGVNSSTTGISEATGLTITATNIVIASVNGSIGIGTGLLQTFNINSNNVTFNATSNSVYVSDSASGNINFVNVLSGSNVVNNAADLNGSGTYYFVTTSQLSSANFVTLSGSSITANYLNLVNNQGSIGNLSDNFSINANNLNINSANFAYINDTANSVNLNSSVISASGTLSLTCSGSIYVMNEVSAGSIILTAAGSVLNVNANSIISTQSGSLILNNTNTTSGSITIGANAVLNGMSVQAPSNNNEIYIIIGSLPSNPVNTAVPANVTVNNLFGANTYFGTNGIIANSPNNTINANTWNVIFNGSTNLTPITLDGGVIINSQPGFVINSLDLTNANVTSNILTLQASGAIGGNLIVNSSGVATGGNVIFYGSKDNLSQLTAEDIPSSVTVEFNGFTLSNPIDVNLTSSSTNSQVVINGNQEFISTGGGSSGIMDVNSTFTGATSLNIGNSGIISSDGNLAVVVEGNVQINGQILSQGNLTLSTSTGNNSNIDIANNITSANGIVTISVNGSGAISQTNGLISGNTVSLIAGVSTIGTPSSNLIISAPNLTLNSNGYVYVSDTLNQLANVDSVSTLAGLSLTTTSSVDLNGSILASNNITINSGLNILIAGSLTVLGTGSIDLTVTGTGNIAQASSSNLVTAQSIDLTSGSSDIGAIGSINAFFVNCQTLSFLTSGNAYINNLSSVGFNLNASSVGVGDNLDLVSNSSITINGVINAGLDTGTGNISLAVIGTGNILSNNSNDLLTAGNIALSSYFGNLGNSANNLFVDAGNINIKSAGDAYLNDMASLANLSNTNIIVGNNNVFSLVMSNLVSGSISINSGGLHVGNANGNGTIDLTASGTGSIQENGVNSVLVASAINLKSVNGDIGLINPTAYPLYINTASLSVYSLASVNINNIGSCTVNASQAQELYISESGTSANLNLNGNMQANTVNLITDNNGNIVINAIISGLSGSDANNVTLKASGSIIELLGGVGNPNILTGSLNLYSSTGSIGSSGITGQTAIDTDASNLLVSASANGNAYVFDTNTSTINLQGGSALSFNLTTTASNITLNILNILAGNIININAASNTNIVIQCTIEGIGINPSFIDGNGNSMNDATSVTIQTNGTGNILSTVNTNLGEIYTESLSLISGSGNIGMTIPNSLLYYNIATDATTLSAKTSGDVYLDDLNLTANVNMIASSGNIINYTGQYLTFTGLINVNNLYVQANQSITITNTIEGLSAGTDAQTVNLNTGGSVISLINTTTPIILTQNLAISSLSGNIGSSGISGQSVIFTDASSLTFSTSKNVYVSDSNSNVINIYPSSILSPSPTNPNIFNLVSTGNLTGLIFNGNFVANSFTLTTYSSATNLNIVGSSSGTIYSTSNFTLISNGNLSNLNFNSKVNSSDVVITLEKSGNIIFANNLQNNSEITAASTTLTVDGSGSILSQNGSLNPSIIGDYLFLNAGIGSIGSVNGNGYSSLVINVENLTSVSSGNVYLTDVNSAGITINASSGNLLNLTVENSTNNVNIGGTLNFNTIDLAVSDASSYAYANQSFIIVNSDVLASNINFSTAQFGGITVNSTVGTANSNVSFDVQGTGYITTGTNGVIIGNGLSLVSSGGEIGFNGAGLITQANNIVFSAGLSVGINNTSANLNVGNSGSGANVYVITSGNLTGSGTITAPVVGLYSIYGTSGIGTSGNIMQLDAHNIGIEAFATSSSVYVNDTYTGSTIMQASQASNIFKLDTAGALTIYAQINQGGVTTLGKIAGSIIAIAANDANGGYGIYNDANIVANDFIFLTASGNGYIAEPATGALMYAPNVSLVSGGGAIGADGRILLNSTNVAASTVGLNSFVNIYDEAANSSIVGGQSGSYFTFNTNGNVNIYGGIATGAGTKANGGAINISANGSLNVGVNGTGISMTTNNGPIVVINNSATNGSIDLAKGDYIYTNTPSSATPGYIVFNVGAYAQTNTTNPNPANISDTTSGGANIFYGVNGISAPLGGNVLNAKGQSIVFNTGSLPANAITLGGNVSITADPPVAPNNIGIVQNSVSGNVSITADLPVSSLVNLSGLNVIQNNIANMNLVTPNATSLANSNLFNNAAMNVLDNNQATAITNNSNNVNSNKASEYSYLTDNEDNNEIVNNTSLIMPIAYNHEVASLTAQSINANNSLAVSNAARCQTSGLTFNFGISNNAKNNASLSYGSVVISASHNMEISLGSGTKLSLKRGAIVLAIANGNVVSVYDLHDNSANSVVVTGKGVNAIALAPGRHVTIAKTNSAIDFAYVNQVGKIAYRGLNTTLKNGNASYVSDFSIPSAISAIKPLKTMFRSNDAKVAALANQIFKTIVVVTQSTSGRGVYEQVVKPKLIVNCSNSW